MTPPKHKQSDELIQRGWFDEALDLSRNRLGILLIGVSIGGGSWTAIKTQFGDKNIHISKMDEVSSKLDTLDRDLKAYETVDGMAHQALNDRLDTDDKKLARINRKGHFYTFN